MTKMSQSVPKNLDSYFQGLKKSNQAFECAKSLLKALITVMELFFSLLLFSLCQ